MLKSIDKIQTLLPLGYLFLVILGLVKECVYYYQVGINYLKYSSIMDILISPIAAITEHPLILLVTIALFVFHFYLPKILLKYKHKKWIQKTFELKQNLNELSTEDQKEYLIVVTFRSLIIYLISFFLGFGIAGGYSQANNIKNKKLSYDYLLHYNSGESETIFLIGFNSIYYFYLANGNQNIKITPVNSIKNLELTNNKTFK